MTKYKILSATKQQPDAVLSALELEVNSHLAEGWSTTGGVSLSMSGTILDKHAMFFACQAVEKND